jgi:hypothetical protein
MGIRAAFDAMMRATNGVNQQTVADSMAARDATDRASRVNADVTKMLDDASSAVKAAADGMGKPNRSDVSLNFGDRWVSNWYYFAGGNDAVHAKRAAMLEAKRTASLTDDEKTEASARLNAAQTAYGKASSDGQVFGGKAQAAIDAASAKVTQNNGFVQANVSVLSALTDFVRSMASRMGSL